MPGPPPPPPQPGKHPKPVSSAKKQKLEQIKKAARSRPDWNGLLRDIEVKMCYHPTFIISTPFSKTFFRFRYSYQEKKTQKTVVVDGNPAIFNNLYYVWVASLTACISHSICVQQCDGDCLRILKQGYDITKFFSHKGFSHSSFSINFNYWSKKVLFQITEGRKDIKQSMDK